MSSETDPKKDTSGFVKTGLAGIAAEFLALIGQSAFNNIHLIYNLGACYYIRSQARPAVSGQITILVLDLEPNPDNNFIKDDLITYIEKATPNVATVVSITCSIKQLQGESSSKDRSAYISEQAKF